MIFSGIVKSSLIDYPGKISTVLFVPGCNYNCFYCHNRSLIEDLNVILDIDELNEFLVKRQGMIDAIVVSGGEPTLHDDLIEFFKSMKMLGYLTKIDTNGSNPHLVKALLKSNLLDYVAIDYKSPSNRYQEICGEHASSEIVLETIQVLLDAKIDFEVRTTVIPQLSLDDLITMAKELPNVPRYVLNPYRKPLRYLEKHTPLINEPPYSEKQIAEFAEFLKLYQSNVVLMF
jgi:pyruvate formate lyase activating enzyme